MDILYVDNLPLEIGTSFERILLQLWPAALLMFFLASGPLQLVAAKPHRNESDQEGEQARSPGGGNPLTRPAFKLEKGYSRCTFAPPY